MAFEDPGVAYTTPERGDNDGGDDALVLVASRQARRVFCLQHGTIHLLIIQHIIAASQMGQEQVYYCYYKAAARTTEEEECSPGTIHEPKRVLDENSIGSAVARTNKQCAASSLEGCRYSHCLSMEDVDVTTATTNNG